MGWSSVAPAQDWRKGPWTPEEDKLLFDYVTLHGEGRWSSVARCAGLNRSGKSCRLRWVNYLRPGLKRGQITPQEEGVIIELHSLWGNKWSTIARYLPGRTDNEIKNYWRTHFKKKERSTRKASQRKKSQNMIKQAKPAQLLQKQQLEIPKTETNMIPMEELPVTTDEEQINQQLITQAPDKQELIFMYPNPAIEEQNLIMNPSSSTWIDAMCHDQDGSWWGSLWNLGDQTPTEKPLADQLQQQQDQYCSKVALVQPNQATITDINANNSGFSWGGEMNNLYNIEGCIF